MNNLRARLKAFSSSQTFFRYCLTAIMAFLLGRTRLAGGLSPFGPAFYAGVRRLDGPLSIIAALASLAGSASARRWDMLGYHALATALLTFAVRPKGEGEYRVSLDGLIAGFLVALSRGVVDAATSISLYGAVFALLEGMCAVIVFLLTTGAMREKGDAGQGDHESLLVLSLLAVVGLGGIHLGGIALSTVVVMGMTLLTAYAAGPGAGAVAGLAGGLLSVLGGAQDPALVGLLGVSGILAGVGAWFGKAPSLFGYLSAGLLMSLCSDQVSPAPARYLVAMAFSSLPVLVLSPKAMAKIAVWFPSLSENPRPARPKAKIDPVTVKTAAVAHALTEMSRVFQEASVTVTGETPADSASELLKQVAERVCGECERQSVCWGDEFGESYRAFSDLARHSALAGHISSASDASSFADRCVQFSRVAREMNHYEEIRRLETRVSSIVTETKECLAYQYRCLGQLLSPAARPRVKDQAVVRSKLKVTLRGETVAAEGAGAAGDMWVRYDLGPGKVLIVLADGMGKGARAAKQSGETLSMLKALLDCGLDYDTCVCFLNSALFLSCRPDDFIALDCLLVDGETERAYFHKLGSPPSFVRKEDGNVLVVRGQKPPAGALGTVPSLQTGEPIAPGDIILLVSDGVFRSSPVPARAEHLILSKIRRLKEGTAEAAVRALMGRGNRNSPEDDVTVVAARIDRI